MERLLAPQVHQKQWQKDSYERGVFLITGLKKMRQLVHNTICRCVVIPTTRAKSIAPVHTLQLHRVDKKLVEQAFLVPKYAIKDLEQNRQVMWSDVVHSPSLTPFLKDCIWHQIALDHFDVSNAIWNKLDADTDYVLVLKVRCHMIEIPSFFWVKVKSLLENCDKETLQFIWPLRWNWLIIWASGTLCSSLLGSYIDGLAKKSQTRGSLALGDVSFSSLRSTLAYFLIHLIICAHFLRLRAAVFSALRECDMYKEAGSIAYHSCRLDVAADQFSHGAAAAVKLERSSNLNRKTLQRCLALKAACLNNRCLVRLKQENWLAAAEDADKVLSFVNLPTPIRAKALFRSASAHYRLGDKEIAISDLLEAKQINYRSEEVLEMLKLFRLDHDLGQWTLRGDKDD